MFDYKNAYIAQDMTHIVDLKDVESGEQLWLFCPECYEPVVYAY